jgi:hypothetical protein
MRTEYFIPIEKELELIQKLSDRVIEDGYNASNTVVVTVSSDYSAITGMLMRHNLSFEGEIADGFSVDVPYPDQKFEGQFITDLKNSFFTNDYKFYSSVTLLLVENGVIRGGNYTFLCDWINKTYRNINTKTLTLFENTHSKFKSDYVGQYYNDTVEDLTFHYERENNHWK